MELARHGLTVVERKVSNFLPLEDGRHLLAGEGRTQGEVAKFSARDAERLPEYERRLEVVAAILRDDVARASAAVLTSHGHDDRTYDLTGPASFSLAEAAALMGASFEDETDEQAYASRASYGAPDWEVAGWVSSYQAIRDGSLDVVSSDVRELTGTEPVALADYLDQAA